MTKLNNNLHKIIYKNKRNTYVIFLDRIYCCIYTNALALIKILSIIGDYLFHFNSEICITLDNNLPINSCNLTYTLNISNLL